MGGFRANSRTLLGSLSLSDLEENYVVERREPFYKWTQSRVFEWINLLMSAAVVVEFGVIADYDVDYQETVVDEAVDSVLAVYFCVEFLIRFFSYRNWRKFFTARNEWKWNVLDLVLLSVRICRAWIMPYVSSPAEFGVWRIVRLVEMLRIIRVLYFVPSVRITLNALGKASVNTLPISALLILTLYAEATVCTLIFKMEEDFSNLTVSGEPSYFENRFGTVAWSMVTNLQLAVFDDAGGVIRASSQISIALSIFLFVCIAVNAFMVLNVLIGFIYDLVEDTSSVAIADMSRARINATFANIDKDLSGEITEQEYEAQAKPVLRAHGINEEVVQNAFAIIDSDGNGTLNRTEFTDYLVKMIRAPSSEEVIKVMAALSAAEQELLALKQMQRTGVVPPNSDLSSFVVSPGSQRRRSVFTSLVRSRATAAPSMAPKSIIDSS